MFRLLMVIVVALFVSGCNVKPAKPPAVSIDGVTDTPPVEKSSGKTAKQRMLDKSVVTISDKRLRSLFDKIDEAFRRDIGEEPAPRDELIRRFIDQGYLTTNNHDWNINKSLYEYLCRIESGEESFKTDP